MTLQQVYKNELYYLLDNECPPNSMDFEESNRFLNQKVSEKCSANDTAETQINSITYGPGYKHILPTVYCSRNINDILPNWMLKNKICPTQITTIQHDTNEHVWKSVRWCVIPPSKATAHPFLKEQNQPDILKKKTKRIDSDKFLIGK